MVCITIQRNSNIFFCQLYVFLSYCFLLSATEYFLAHPSSGFFYQPDMNFSSHCGIVIPSFDCSSYSFHWKWALSVPFGVLFHNPQCYGSLTEFYIAETLQQLFFSFLSVQQVSFRYMSDYILQKYLRILHYFSWEQQATPKEIQVLSYISFPNIVTHGMFGYIPNPECRRLYAWMFSGAMEIVRLSEARFGQCLFTAYRLKQR